MTGLDVQQAPAQKIQQQVAHAAKRPTIGCCMSQLLMIGLS